MFFLLDSKKHLPLLLAAGLMLVGLSSQHAQSAALTPAQVQQLNKGQVLIQETPVALANDPKNVQRRVTFQMLVDRPVAQVWQYVKNQEKMFTGEPRMKKVRLLNRVSPTQEAIEYTVDLSKLLPRFIYTTQVTYQPQQQIKFKRTSGSFKDMEGLCQLKPYAGGDQTLFTYSLYIDTGFFIPQVLVRNIMKQDFPSILKGVKARIYQQYPSAVASGD